MLRSVSRAGVVMSSMLTKRRCAQQIFRVRTGLRLKKSGRVFFARAGQEIHTLLAL